MLKGIKDLTYVERDILCLIASFKDKGLRVSDADIAETVLLSTAHVGRVINSIKDKGYAEIRKPKSKYRIVLWSVKTKNLLQHRCGSKKNSTSAPVQKYIVSKPSKEVLTDGKTFGDDKLFSGDTSQPAEESLRPAHWKEGYSYACPEEYAEQLLGEIEE
jgi:DNA-binding MarR family transcriptional regulator